MSSIEKYIAQTMRSLVSRYGSYEAYAAGYNERWEGGACCKGTVHKKMNGSMEWGWKDLLFIQEALGKTSITTAFHKRFQEVEEIAVESPAIEVVELAKESSEAVVATLQANIEASPDADAVALRELHESLEQTKRTIAAIEERDRTNLKVVSTINGADK